MSSDQTDVKPAFQNAPICGAKTRSGGRCQQPAMPNGKCRMHGGLSLVGAAVPAFKHGRYSKYLPLKLMDRYQEALGNLDLLSLQDDLALLDTRLSELLERTQTPDSDSFWLDIQTLSLQVFDALNASPMDTDQAKKSAVKLVELANGALRNEDAWSDIKELLEQRRKTAETEHNRLVKAKQVMTLDEVMTVFAVITDSIKRNVSNIKEQSAISQDIARVLTAKSVGRT